jgi:hypothetical protein
VSDIDTEVVDSLKVLDPRRPIREADFISSSQHVRERQRIAALDAEVDALQRQALALGAQPAADFAPQVLLE